MKKLLKKVFYKNQKHRRKNNNMLLYMCKTKTSVIKRKLTKEDIDYDNNCF